MRWFLDVAYGFDARVVDVSEDLAALSLQGPNSRAILKKVASGIDFDNLAYFHMAHGDVETFPLTVTRTGYTGDLGYELWVRPEDAGALWDHLLDAGGSYGVLPAGIVPLDIARIEAGMLMLDVDYISSHHARIEAQKSSPFELGLGWAVALDGADFIGRKPLRAEKARGSKWSFVGVAIDWPGLERLFDKVDLPPQVTGRASRDPVPIFKGSRQVGQITSRTFSPLLKKYIGIGTLLTQYAAPGTQVDIEVTVEYSRERAPATIAKTPFYNPPHKKA
jgi:aminomethyltransferase